MIRKKDVIIISLITLIVIIILTCIFPVWWNSGKKENAKYGITTSVHKVNKKQIEVKMECTAKDGYGNYHLEHGYFRVEKATILGWKEMPVLNGNYFSNATYEGIEGSHDLKTNWIGKYGELPNGVYRIGMGMLDADEERAGFFYTTFHIDESGNTAVFHSVWFEILLLFVIITSLWLAWIYVRKMKQ
jgi:hypothetical protein